MPKKQGLKPADEGLDVREHDVVAPGVEVGYVFGALEEEAAESPEPDQDAAFFCGVEDGDAETAADLLHGLGCLPVHRLRDVPGGDETDLGARIFFEQALAEDLQLRTEEIRVFPIAMHQHGVIVAADHDDVVRRNIRQVRVALAHGRAEEIRFPLIGEAIAVPAPVVVLHIVFGGQLVVPGLLDGAGGILHIAVAEYDDFLAAEGRTLNGGRSFESCRGHQDQLLLRDGVQRQQHREYEQNSLHSERKYTKNPYL